MEVLVIVRLEVGVKNKVSPVEIILDRYLRLIAISLQPVVLSSKNLF